MFEKYGERSLDHKTLDPEDHLIDAEDEREKREKMLDKTVADSFPASDPPCTWCRTVKFAVENSCGSAGWKQA
jgi:hypothetical protein